jgi:hypothetical protein
MKLLLIGDVIGKPGRTLVRKYLPGIVEGARKAGELIFVIANGENAAGGFGITESTASELFNMGVNVITTGNHVWDKKESVQYLPKEDRVLRPLNYPPGTTPGFGSGVYLIGNLKVGVINLAGRVFMPNFDCPFRTIDPEIEKLGNETSIIIVDFHAEATSEKQAMGFYLDARVSAVIGTHTHVQTADEKILPGGTAYITDVGMTGPVWSIIGIKTEMIIRKFLTQMPMKYEVADGEGMFCAVLMDIDEDSGRAVGIKRLMLTQ